MQLPQLSLPFTARKSAVKSEAAVADMPKSLGPEILFSNPTYPMADQQELSQLDREFDIKGWKTADCMPGNAADLHKLWLDNEDSWLTPSPQDNEDEYDMLCSDEEPSNTTVSTEVQARGYLNWSDPSTPIGLTEEYTGPMSNADAFLAGLLVLPVEALPPGSRNCGICLQDYLTVGSNMEHPALPCRHVVGQSCLERWLSPCEARPRTWCPVCGAHVFENDQPAEEDDMDENEFGTMSERSHNKA